MVASAYFILILLHGVNFGDEEDKNQPVYQYYSALYNWSVLTNKLPIFAIGECE
jgi:hypothetical protein